MKISVHRVRGTKPEPNAIIERFYAKEFFLDEPETVAHVLGEDISRMLEEGMELSARVLLCVHAERDSDGLPVGAD